MSRAGIASIVAIAAIACAATSARADVFEIAADGRMVDRSHGGAADGDTARGDAAGEAAPGIPAGALTIVAPADAPARFRPAVEQAASRYGVSASLLAALVWHESRWQPAATSNKGAIGLAQLMPATARALAVDPRDAAANLDGAAHYLRLMLDRFDGDVERALAAYNAGPGRVVRANGIPAIGETRRYVAAIIDRVAGEANNVRLGAGETNNLRLGAGETNNLRLGAGEANNVRLVAGINDLRLAAGPAGATR